MKWNLTILLSKPMCVNHFLSMYFLTLSSGLERYSWTFSRQVSPDLVHEMKPDMKKTRAVRWIRLPRPAPPNGVFSLPAGSFMESNAAPHVQERSGSSPLPSVLCHLCALLKGPEQWSTREPPGHRGQKLSDSSQGSWTFHNVFNI